MTPPPGLPQLPAEIETLVDALQQMALYEGHAPEWLSALCDRLEASERQREALTEGRHSGATNQKEKTP